MSEFEGLRAPDWYVDHFLPFGHTVERLREAWDGLSETARDNYRRALNTPPIAAIDGDA